jgi:hypothetical protein
MLLWLIGILTFAVGTLFGFILCAVLSNNKDYDKEQGE